MSGPKHLWSGDWERESAAVSEKLAGRRVTPPTPDPEPAVTPAPPRAPRPRRVPRAGRPGMRRVLVPVLAGVVVLAAAALALSSLLGSSGTPAPTTAARSSLPLAPATTAGTAPRPVKWLGMEIETIPPGAAVVETVALGSPGDRAGIEPGDAILMINNRRIRGTGDIAGAIHGLHAGDVVKMEISNGSSVIETEVALTAPPSAYP